MPHPQFIQLPAAPATALAPAGSTTPQLRPRRALVSYDDEDDEDDFLKRKR
jgi:hypothetical protein